VSNIYPLSPNSYRVHDTPSPVDTGDVTVITDGGDVAQSYDETTGTTQITLPDGDVQITVGPPQSERKESEFEDNLAESLSESELSTISERILLGIEQDDQSRSAWLQNMSNGISLLGLEIKTPRGAAATGAAPAEGVSTVDHPLLLEATLRFQANARGELLPADGPVKVKNDGQGDELATTLAMALEKDLNHYLTSVAKEYYPDTDRLLLMLGFSGIAFKKGYHCPIKRRPVLASIDAKDLIVSNAATDIDGAGRVTHRIMMRPSVLKRMQMLGAYRDTNLPVQGMPALKNPIDQKIDQVQGIAPPSYIEPSDQDRELYECYCEIEVPGFEHEDDKGKLTGLPLPYKVTIDKEARKILEIRRNWREDDDLCMPRNRIVAYIFVPGLGFYGIGLLNILGNATKAVTAAWRLMIDAGMFANFPGFLYLKSLAKQLTNQFRIPPGGGMPIDTVGNDIRASVMPLPYKDPSAVFIQLIDSITTTAQRVGGTAELQIGEGKQDAPVGTTLALIEQATKLMSAVHKRLHTAQGQEFSMLKELLTEDPSALWRHNKKSKVLKALTDAIGSSPIVVQQDQADDKRNAMFVAALNDCELIPKADPNTASQTERYLKTSALKQIQQGNPNIDQDKVDLHAMHVLGVDDAESYFKPPPEPGTVPPNPEAMSAQADLLTAQARLADSQTKSTEAQAKTALAGQTLDYQTQKLQSEEQVAHLGLAREMVIHNSDSQQKGQALQADQQNRQADRVHQFRMKALSNRHDAIKMGLGHTHDANQQAHDRRHELLTTALGHAHEANQGELDREHAIALEKAKPKPSAGVSKR
jgi:hypothetical protein